MNMVCKKKLAFTGAVGILSDEEAAEWLKNMRELRASSKPPARIGGVCGLESVFPVRVIDLKGAFA